MSKKSIVLLSGGLDSSVNLYAAQLEGEVLLAITFNYGQKAFAKELEASQKICQALGVRHQVIDLPWLAKVTYTSLVSQNQDVPVGQQIQLDNHEHSLVTAQAVWVPNRNGVFLNVAAAMAEALEVDDIVVGFNKEEADTFPDNSADFIIAMEKSFEFSTATKVKIKCFTINMNKTMIVEFGKSLEVKFQHLWPCYFSKEKICEECESCQRFLRALKEVGVTF